jgi:hypothetical protein
MVTFEHRAYGRANLSCLLIDSTGVVRSGGGAGLGAADMGRACLIAKDR